MSACVPSRRVWTSLFSAAGLPSDSIAKYADIFANERLRLDLVVDLSRSELEELGITALGDQKAVRRCAERMIQEQRNQSKDNALDNEDSMSDDQSRGQRRTQQRTRESDSDRKPKAKPTSHSSRSKHVERYSDSEESDKYEDNMEVDNNREKPSRVPSKSSQYNAVQRLRVVRTGDERNESARALRMLSMANSTAISSRDYDDRNEDVGRGKMRSDLMAQSGGLTRDRHLPPPDPVNGLSRLASAPSLEPVLIRNLKSSIKSDALKRLGPRSQHRIPSSSARSLIADHGSNGKRSAMSRLDKGRGLIERRGNMLLRTIQGFSGVEQSRRRPGKKSSALQRLGDRHGAATDSSAPHPLSRC